MNAVTKAGAAVTGLALRQTRRAAIVVVVLVGVLPALVAVSYESTVGANASALAALAGNPAVRTLFGEPVALDSAGGFAVWRTGTVVGVLLGVWGLLAGTRITRGEEESGRWDLLLAGRLPLAGVVARQAGVLTALACAAGIACGAGLVAAGTDPRGALLHGAGIASLGVFFVGVAVLAAQVFPHRASATGAAAAVLAAGLLLRMVADGVDALAWLRWLTPFGLIELTAPYAADRWMPVLVCAAAAALCVAGGLVAAGRRDVRGGLLNPPVGRAPRLALLGSVAGFAGRRTIRPLIGWTVGIGAYYLLIGLIAASMIGFLAGNPRFADLAGQAGFGDLALVEGYAATLFALLAVPVGAFTAIRLAAFAADEDDRRLTMMYAGPVTRERAVGAEILVTLTGAVVLAVAAGVAAWAGTAMSGAGLGLVAALAGALMTLPVVALCLGAAVLALGVSPRMVAALGNVPAAGGFLLYVLSDSLGAPDWVRQVSPFAHLARVPAEQPNWGAAAVMTGIGVLLGLAGVVAYRRRDLRG